MSQEIQQLVQDFDQPNMTLQHLQMICLILLGFRGFMRWDDMRRIQVNNVEVSAQHMTVFVESRKNDQFREGHLIPIARMPNASLCAVQWMERFLAQANHEANQALFGKVRQRGTQQVI